MEELFHSDVFIRPHPPQPRTHEARTQQFHPTNNHLDPYQKISKKKNVWRGHSLRLRSGQALSAAFDLPIRVTRGRKKIAAAPPPPPPKSSYTKPPRNRPTHPRTPPNLRRFTPPTRRPPPRPSVPAPRQ